MGGDADTDAKEDQLMAAKLLKSLTTKADTNVVQIKADGSFDRCGPAMPAPPLAHARADDSPASAGRYYRMADNLYEKGTYRRLDAKQNPHKILKKKDAYVLLLRFVGFAMEIVKTDRSLSGKKTELNVRPPPFPQVQGGQLAVEKFPGAALTRTVPPGGVATLHRPWCSRRWTGWRPTRRSCSCTTSTPASSAGRARRRNASESRACHPRR